MSISAEEKKRYFQEAVTVLRREGFRGEPSAGGRLGVWLDDHPILRSNDMTIFFLNL